MRGSSNKKDSERICIGQLPCPVLLSGEIGRFTYRNLAIIDEWDGKAKP